MKVKIDIVKTCIIYLHYLQKNMTEIIGNRSTTLTATIITKTVMVTLIAQVTVVMLNRITKIRVTITITEKITTTTTIIATT